MPGETTPPPCAIIESVMADLRHRQAVGLATYGVTLSDAPIDVLGWLRHAYEEALDQACYLRIAIERLGGVLGGAGRGDE